MNHGHGYSSPWRRDELSEDEATVRCSPRPEQRNEERRFKRVYARDEYGRFLPQP